MNNSISFTIPLDVGTLNRTAEMLQAMAVDLTDKPCGDCDKTQVETTNHELTCSSEFPNKEPLKPLPPATNSEESLYTSPGTIDEQIAAKAAEKETPPSGVDLDSAGLPWDHRIHSGGKTKLVNGGTWKRKRGLDAALVEQVETELRAAMAAPAPAATTTPPETPAIVETTPPTPPETPAIVETTTPAATTTPPETPAETAEPITFPLFMSKVTNAMALGTLTDVMILEAVNKFGLASLPLLSARPDIIPAVDAELFPNG